jgi:hypothetical protein
MKGKTNGPREHMKKIRKNYRIRTKIKINALPTCETKYPLSGSGGGVWIGCISFLAKVNIVNSSAAEFEFMPKEVSRTEVSELVK